MRIEVYLYVACCTYARHVCMLAGHPKTRAATCRIDREYEVDPTWMHAWESRSKSDGDRLKNRDGWVVHGVHLSLLLEGNVWVGGACISSPSDLAATVVRTYVPLWIKHIEFQCRLSATAIPYLCSRVVETIQTAIKGEITHRVRRSAITGRELSTELDRDSID